MVIPATSKAWCASAPNCVYRQFDGLCQHEVVYSLEVGPIVRQEISEYIDSAVAAAGKGLLSSITIDIVKGEVKGEEVVKITGIREDEDAGSNSGNSSHGLSKSILLFYSLSVSLKLLF
jgi:hypothetical protein